MKIKLDCLDKMKKILISLFVLSSCNILFSQNLAVQNPSFEGPPGPHITPPLWGICMPGRTPDTQPGIWGVSLPPSDGSSYLGMCHEQSSSWQEGASQELRNELTGNLEPMQAGVTYQFTIDVSDHPTSGGWNVSGPVELLVWGGFSDCSETELLWSSGDVEPNYTWITYNVSFTPSMNFSHIMFQCNGLTSPTGYLIIDNMSSIVLPCTPPQGSIVPTNFNGYNISCNGYSDGGIDLTVSGSSLLGYTYLWNNNATTEDITNLSAGVYSVVITDLDNASCSTSTSIILTEPIIQMNEVVSPTCFGLIDGEITLNTTGGLTPYTYLWNTGETTSNLTDLDIGVYSVQITDSYGCIDSATYIITEASQLSSQYSTSDYNGYNVSCNEGQDGSIDLTVSGSVPGYSYQWSNGDTIEGINGLSAGTYSYVVTDQNGCITSDTIEIIEPTINIQESVVDVSCFGATNGSVSVNVSGSTAPYYVFWNNNINTTLVSSGTYVYQIIDSIGCVYFDSLIVSEPDSFIVTESVIDVSCNGSNDGSISLVISGATPPFVVNWFGANIVNAQAGTYNYTIVDSNNCYFSEIAIVNEPNQIDVLNQVVDPSCGNTNDGSVSLQISGGNSPYLVDWAGSNPNSLGIGSYVFLVTDDNNCVDSNTVTLTSVSNIQVVSEITQISCNSFCDGSIDLTITGGVSPYTVDWFGVNPAFLCEGSVSYEIIDAVGCYYMQNFQIISPDSVELSISQFGMQLEGNASGGVAPYSYEWFNDFGSLVNSQTVNITSNGSYYCIAIDVNHCQSDTVEYYYSETSIEDIGVASLNIYPNPTDNILNIEFESGIENDFSLYFIDVLGQKIMIDRIKKFKGNYTYKLDLQRFAQGIYILELRSGSEIYNKKVIKK